MVKHRAGNETHTVIDWTEHAAVQRPGADGKATNTLAVESHAGGRALPGERHRGGRPCPAA